MQGLPAYCPSCQVAFEMPGMLFKDVHRAAIRNLRTRCPKCGGPAIAGDGVYTAIGTELSLVDGPPLTRAIVEQLMAAVHAPGVTAQDVWAFRAVAQAVAAGEIDAVAAEERVREIGQSFAALWEWLKPKSGFDWLMLVLAVLSLIIGALPDSSDDKPGASEHRPDPSIELLPYRERIEREVYAALQGGSPTGFSAAAQPSRSSKSRPRVSQARMPVTGENRHTRRKADAIAKKRKRT